MIEKPSYEELEQRVRFLEEELNSFKKLREENSFEDEASCSGIINSSENQSKLSEQRLREILDNLPVGIFQTSLEGRYLYANPYTANMLGYDSPEDLIQSITDIGTQIYKNPEDRSEVISLLNRQGFVKDFELQSICKDGSIIWCSISIRSVNKSNGKTLYFEGTSQNITDRKMVEMALKESEDRYKNYVGKSFAGVYVVQDGRFVFLNDNAASFAGYRPEELIGRPSNSIVHPEDLNSTLENSHKMLRGDVLSPHEFRIVTKEGQIRWIMETVTYITYEGRRAILGNSMDITERKLSDEARRKSERRLNEMIDFLPDATLAIDAEKKITIWNKAIERMTGLKAEEMIGKGDYEYTIPFYGVRRPQLMDLVWENNDTIIEKYPFVNREGDYLSAEVFCNALYNGNGTYVFAKVAPLYDLDGNIVGAIESIKDISERKKAEENLNNALLFNKHIIDSAQEGIIVYDHEMRYQLWNPYMEKLTGLNFSEVEGKTPTELFHFMVESGAVDDLQRILNGEAFNSRTFHHNIPQSGRAGWVVQTNAPLRNAAGEIIGILGIVRDITEEKRMQEQLAHAQKMESIGRLAGGVAHDFNNMLGVIIGRTEMAMEQFDASQPIHRDLMEIHKAAQRSAVLTGQLLAFARKQTISPRVLDLNKAIGNMSNLLKRIIGEDIDLAWLPSADLWPVNIDPSQIDQILANLCVNARDAIAEIGKITIETANITFDDSYCRDHAEFIPGDYVLLAISDDGCGMDKEILSNIFEPFFTTKELGKGTGLGLATVYGIVKQNKGFINLYSEPGHGTTVKIYLPRHVGKGASKSIERAQIARGS
ncbi:MAG: Sensor histidine kinase RcsC [Syntrophus sp. SKADARSKE-3]|nr:Sensor histidine kinase RcsC [Syntrophus sp. SKADARSKE-3]